MAKEPGGAGGDRSMSARASVGRMIWAWAALEPLGGGLPATACRRAGPWPLPAFGPAEEVPAALPPPSTPAPPRALLRPDPLPVAPVPVPAMIVSLSLSLSPCTPFPFPSSADDTLPLDPLLLVEEMDADRLLSLIHI